MTDFELIALFNEYETMLQVSFMNFVTIIFAFLIASFFVAEKLSKAVTAVVIIVFTLASIQQGGSFFLYLSDQIALMPEIIMRDALSWTTQHRAGLTVIVPASIFIYFFTFVFAYLGSLFFFFRQRHQGLKAS